MEQIKNGGRSGLTSYHLKLIGIILMVLDHIHQMFLPFGAPTWLTMLGRLVIPIFLFLLAEGYHYTHSRKQYLIRLLVAGWIMGALTFAITRLFPVDDVVISNNIFLTMFLSLLYMWMLDLVVTGIKQKQVKQISLGLLGFIAPNVISFFILLVVMPVAPAIGSVSFLMLPSLISVEGGWSAVLLAVLFHVLRPYGKKIQMIPLVAIGLLNAVTAAGSVQWMMIFAVIPLMFYNGKPGRKSKWFFYIFYPTHIFILYFISYLLH